MLAFRLLRHSVPMLFRDPRATLRIGLPYLVVVAATQIITAKTQAVEAQFGLLEASQWRDAKTFADLLIWLVLLPTAVSWHRHVLLGEPPRLIARGRWRQVLSYALTGLLFSLLLVMTVVMGVLAASQLFALFGDVTISLSAGIPLLAFMLLGLTLAAAFALRLATAFPGAALGQIPAIKTAWRATRGHMRSFLALGLVYVMAQGGLALLSARVMSPTQPNVGGVLAFGVMSWATFMLSLSVLTTLWGHFVEGRDLR
ncbi:hypothetical protein [Paracoccus zeaxanthinifaciens]|uniref:hypothetical protein n=1 Tax=Paracoccus zeaxanthinifaciens TaxID=187400 RepID=UPI0003B5A856|nr:hypothetical protein [Paracoccus zeaxanthinifaciens]